MNGGFPSHLIILWGEIMEGITVLNQTLHEGAIIEPLFEIALALVGIGIVLGIVGSIMAASRIKIISYIFLYTSLTFLAAATLIGILGPREEITRYQVLIDDSVSFIEFNDRYKIISQDGAIYTIQEREP